jgi:hypothetical protein
MALTAERLREVLAYDPDTGIFTWISPSGRRAKQGDRAGSFNTSIKYRVIGIDGVRYYEHRLAYLYMTGKWPEIDLDHINCNKSDNRWRNLREATMSQNLANVAFWGHNTSGIKGVQWHKKAGRWTSAIAGEYLGLFDTKEQASEAYRSAAIRKFGNFARVR